MSRRGAFTLVEILVVIGIIAVLVAVLLPALSRSRGHARQVACASNVRQVTAAFLAYASEHDGALPGPAVVRPLDQDWIYWQPGRNLADGKLVRYLGRTFNADVLRCPADDGVRLERNLPFFNRTYDYSYCVNQFLVGPWVPPLKISQVRNSASMILVAEESEWTINDGCWFPPWNWFATRHNRPKPDEHGVGNAGFLDGHVESVPYTYAHDPRHHKPEPGQVPGPMLVLPSGPLPRPTGSTVPMPRPPATPAHDPGPGS